MTTTLCSAQDVLDRVGPLGNATIIASTAIVERYIATSEGTICTETKRKWVSDYASISESAVKETLRICAASHAANAIIKYDMRGFSTSAQAITMLNVNYEDFSRTLKALKDLDSTTFRSVT